MCFAFFASVFSSCQTHLHVYDTAWSYDETAHWHAAVCGHGDQVKDKAHHSFDNGQCTVCGAAESPQGMGYIRIDDETLSFGSYPQSRVSDMSLISLLNGKAGALPQKGQRGDWNGYGYYISGFEEEYMWYIDLVYNGIKYRGVYFTDYRPFYLYSQSSSDFTYQLINGFSVNTVYWFEYEPLLWRVLDQSDGKALLMCRSIIDAQNYGAYFSDRTVDGKIIHANNYKYSAIREWLNGDFFQTAFSGYNKNLVSATEVDNSAATTSSESNEHACENTSDKVFLLSFQDILNSSFGFSSVNYDKDGVRSLQTTSYALCQGAFAETESDNAGKGLWWLRSPDSYTDNYAQSVDSEGVAVDNWRVDDTFIGVVPAFYIDL